MIKLLVDCHVFDGKYQGTRTYIEGVYRELIKRQDIDFYFCAVNVDNLKNIFGVYDNVHYIKLRFKNKFLRLFFEYPHIISHNNIDFAHFQYILPFFKRCREIVTIHDLLFLDFPIFFPILYRLKNYLLFLLSAHRADLLLTVSEFSKLEINHYFNIPLERIVITSNSVSIPTFSNMNNKILELLQLDKYILEVGRVEPRKNQLLLVKAFVENQLYERYSLVLVGSLDITYKEYDDYLKKVDSLVKSKIKQVSVSYNDLLVLYRNTSLFVFPSYAEGFGIPPLEALANNCPVLCSDVTAMAEFGFPDKYTFNPYNQEELGEKMIKVLSEPYDFTYKDEVLNKYSWKKTSDTLYEQILKKLTNLDSNIIENV